MVSGPSTPFRGEIWWTAVPGDESEETSRQPVLIVQNDVGNAHARTVIAAAVSAEAPRKRYPQVVPLDADLLSRPATVRCDIIRTFEKAGLLERAAVLSRETMAEVDAALCRSLALRPGTGRHGDDELAAG
jgi:mRNA-degrading endonuclease toxin of MazEF toxin-antitoxin module